MVDRNDTAEGMLAYLQRSRALSGPAREKLRSLLQLARESTVIDSDKVGLSTVDDNTAYVYLYNTEGNHFQLVFNVETGVRLHHVPSESRQAATEFLMDWERTTMEESSDALVKHIAGGLKKVIAFQNGKAYELSMREVGEFDAEFYVRQHVDQRLTRMQDAYRETLSSLRSNLENQRARYEQQLSTARQQSLGNIEIDWIRVSQGKFFPYKLPGTQLMGLATISPVLIKRVKWHSDGSDQLFLKKPVKLLDAVIFKEQSGRWHVMTQDGKPYPHPHVRNSRSIGDSDYAIMCTGDAGDAGVEDRLATSSRFETQVKRIREALAGINWGSPYRTEFPEANPESDAYREEYKVFDVYNKLRSPERMNLCKTLAYTTENTEAETIEL